MLYRTDTRTTTKIIRTTDRGERGADDTVPMRSNTHIQDQERTHRKDDERGARFQKITERRLNWYGNVVRGDGEHILRKVYITDICTKEKEERTTENTMERCVPTRIEKYWTESGRGDGQGDMG